MNEVLLAHRFTKLSDQPLKVRAFRRFQAMRTAARNSKSALPTSLADWLRQDAKDIEENPKGPIPRFE